VAWGSLRWVQRGPDVSVAERDDTFDPCFETESIAIGGNDGQAATGELAEDGARAGGQVIQDTIQEEEGRSGCQCAREQLRWRHPRRSSGGGIQVRDESLGCDAANADDACVGP